MGSWMDAHHESQDADFDRCAAREMREVDGLRRELAALQLRLDRVLVRIRHARQRKHGRDWYYAWRDHDDIDAQLGRLAYAQGSRLPPGTYPGYTVGGAPDGAQSYTDYSTTPPVTVSYRVRGTDSTSGTTTSEGADRE